MTHTSATNGSLKEKIFGKNTSVFNEPILEVTFFFSLAFIIACPIAGLYTNQMAEILNSFFRIITSPCPLVTDYYNLGNLAATLLNAGLCGLSFSLMMHFLRTDCQTSNWAGFFLVIAHCFYGLNFLNMWLPVVGILMYSRVNKVSFRDNIDIAMFSTAFAPFISELIFRYPLSHQLVLPIGEYGFSLIGLVFAIMLSVFLGFAVPAMLPGAMKLHRGFNLYNGGLAFGLLGLLIYAWLYNTMGHTAETAHAVENAAYSAHNNSYMTFCNIFFGIVFVMCIIIGWHRNGGSFKGYKTLLKDSGHRTDFINGYGMGVTWINLGTYGLFMIVYLDAVILFTDGVGFTGPTCGVLLAAMSFAASGQHIKNVWPILAGYVVLFAFVATVTVVQGYDLTWTLSDQGYINGAAFATGLCPFAGKYGKRIGCLAGIMCAVMCTTTSTMHGGFMLYNGGLTAGITALILTPMLDHYYMQRNEAGIFNRLFSRREKHPAADLDTVYAESKDENKPKSDTLS